MQKRINITSGTPWEGKVGYSRAVRIGNIIEVAGTTAFDGNEIVGRNDAYEQAHFIFEKISMALKEAGASFKDVIRTRMYVTDIQYSDAVGRAHREIFSDIKPAATLLAVTNLVDPELLVEIEATAITDDGKGSQK